MMNVNATARCLQTLTLGVLLTIAGGCTAEHGGGQLFVPTVVDGTPTPPATPRPPGVPLPPVTGPAATLPIIDLHFHLDAYGDLLALAELLDELGVVRAGNGSNSNANGLRMSAAYPDRFVPFWGQSEFHRAIVAEGAQAWNLTSPVVLDHLDQLETGLRGGQIKGIGMLYVNTLVGGNTNPNVRYPADSPLMQRLWALSAAYQAPLSIAMNASSASVAEMERLLASDRRGVWIWSGTGTFAAPPLVRRLLQTHPNLICELSGRLPLRRDYSGLPSDLIPILDQVNIVDADEHLRPEWKALLDEFPDRFVLGTDVPIGAYYPIAIDVWRHVLEDLSPDTAAKLAHGNAERILGRTP